MPSVVNIQFLQAPPVGAWVELKKNLGQPLNLRETWATVRDANYKVPFNAELTSSQIAYVQAFLADYNSTGNFTAKLVGNNTVEVKHNTENFFATDDVLVSDTSIFNVSVVNTPGVPDFTFISSSVSTSDESVCTQAKITFETSIQADEVISPISRMVNSNPFSFEWFKGQNFVLVVKKGEQSISKNIIMPKLLSAAGIEVSQLVTPTGTKVTINNIFDENLTYSLDNVNFQSSNIFSGILPGDYTVYVRDNFGCTVSKDFTVLQLENQIGTVAPNHYFSPSLSFHFAQEQVIDNREVFKWEFNSLTDDCFTHKVFSDEIYTIQFRTSYQNITAKLLTATGSIPLFVQKVAQNIGLKDARDAVIYPISQTNSGIFFTFGNVYDFDTLQPTDVHSLNGALPAFAKEGNFIQLGINWFVIEQVIFDAEKQASAIIVNITTAVQENVIVKSIYNQDDMDVYEFTVPFASASDFNQIKVELRSDNFPDVDYYSQVIEKVTELRDYHAITYSHSTNTDIMYSTGIVNNIRLPYYITQGYESDDENEVNKTDDGVSSFSSASYDKFIFSFHYLPLQIAMKLKYAVMHDRLMINGRNFVIDGKPEITRLENSQTYNVVVKAFVSDTKFNKQIGIGVGGGTGELIQLLEVGNGNYFKL